jgi:catechol 2,3-dioxygenase-like lactoylglutathione lyase family enzyme
MIVGLNHVTITALDPARTLDFYGSLLGLVEGPRPDLGFPGAWLYAPGQVGQGAALLHIVFGRAAPAAPTGTIDHFAFTARDLAAVKARLDARGWRYELRRLGGHAGTPGIWQLFAHDPDGARVELDFDGSEIP